MNDSLIPFVLTSRHNIPHLRHIEDFPNLQVMCVDDPHTRPFALWLNHTNQLAFGGGKNMGMPLWVMLDCGILSGAIIGFCAPRDALSPTELTRIGVDSTYKGLVPLSEYCACPTLAPHTVSGFSLQSQRPRQGLARRTKALAMLIYGAQHQIGVTQFDNPAIRVHASFGLLRIAMHRPAIHTHAHNTFVYHARMPPADTLHRMARGELAQAPYTSPREERWSFDPGDESHHRRLAEMIAEGRHVWLIPPAWHRDEHGSIHMDLLIS